MPILQRSIRYHRPRAPFCGVGDCTQCLVRTSDPLYLRACRAGFPETGVRPTGHAWPSVRWDLGGVLDLLFPRGIDTGRGFRRPAALRGVYQRVVRRLAGYDRPPSGPLPPLPPSPPREVGVLLIGHGRAGAAVAAALRARGVAGVHAIDRDAPRGPRAPEAPERATAIFLPRPERPDAPFRCLVSIDGAGAGTIAARRVVVATGGYDAGLLFAGNDRPGVLTAEGARTVASAGFDPFRSAVLFGGGPVAERTLHEFAGAIRAVVAPGEIGPEVVAAATAQGVPLYPRHLLVRVDGRRRVRRVVLRARGGGPYVALPADGVVLAHRRIPHPQLFFQAGARMAWDGEIGAYRPETDGAGRTTVPGLYAAGSARGDRTDAAVAAGAEAVAAAVAGDGPSPPAGPPAPAAGDPPPEGRTSPLLGYYRELLEERGRHGKWVACACEDVLLSELCEAHERGYRGIEVVKRYTGLGTGLCQGRYCLPDALLLLANLEQRSPAEVGYITQRPPVVPTTLGALAALPTDDGPTEAGR
ncbi:MAG: 2Fe-2S iron-sulfur cluster-binding protein [Thermoplasmata archaeon]